MFEVSNNADSALAADIGIGAVSFTLATGEGAEFPTLSGAQYFYVRIGTDASNEVVRVTARSGDVCTCLATASAWTAGTRVMLPVCKEIFDAIPRLITADTTYTVRTSGGHFTGLSSALGALKNTLISPTATVTLEIEDGVFVESNPISDAALCSSSILIKGQNSYTTTLTSIQSSGGGAGAWSLVLNVNSVANIAVGNYVLIPIPTGGSNPTYTSGVHEVTNVDAINTRITIASKHRAAAAPSGAVTATITVLPSVISFAAANVDGFTSTGGRGFRGFQNVVIVGGTAGAGLLAVRGGRFQLSASGSDVSVGIAGFSNAVSVSSAGFVDVSYAYLSGSDSYLISASRGGCVEFGSGVATGGGADGINASSSGFIRANLALLTGHAGTNTASATFVSGIDLVGHTATSPATYSPAVNTIANENSYINT